MNKHRKRKFLIYTASYDENSGGIIAQHKLCSILNELDYEAYLHPFYSRYFEIDKNNYQLSNSALLIFFWRTLKKLFIDKREYKNFKTNPTFNTPIFDKKNIQFDDEWIVIYPEITFGNPLEAKNVVRWLLHQPGFHTGKIFYSQGEFIVKFNSAINDFEYFDSITLKSELKVIHYPLEYYNTNGAQEHRAGTAFSLRKRKHKKIQHDIAESISIDDKSHKEISQIFKQVKTFISYDSYTAFSIFAALCGCDSIVIPEDGVDIDKWYPDAKDRLGIAYGFDNIEHARNTRNLILDHVIKEESNSRQNVQRFVNELNNYLNV